MGLGRNKRKTLGIGLPEFIGIENCSHLKKKKKKKMLKADIINHLFTSERRRKSSEISLVWDGFELGF